MGTYYRHTRSERADITYSFRCESCGKENNPRFATIIGTANENSNFKNLNPKQEEKLCRRAHENLVQSMKTVHKNATEKKIFSTEFHDECSYCHKPQSWAVSGLKNKMFENPIICLLVGAVFSVIGVLCHYFSDMDVSLSVAAGIFVAGVIAAAGCLLWNVVKINAKSKKTSSAMQNLPVIDWSSVQNLLNE